MNNDT